MRPAPGRPAARHTRTILAPTLALALLAAGCSSAVNTEPGAVKKGGTLTFAVGLDAQPSNLLQNLSRNNPWLGNVFQSLINVNPQTGEAIPVLATKWVFAPDGKSVDITLRSDVKWHNGDPFTADDVKYTYDLLGAKDTQTNIDYAHFASLDVTSPTELHGTFDTPSQPQALDLFGRAPILHKGTYKANDDGKNLIGTGPYTFTDWQPGSGYNLKKFPDYWGDEPTLDTVKFIVTADATAELNALKSGRAQLAWGLSTSDAKTLTSSGDWATADNGGTIYSFSVNTTKPPFTNPKVREAIGYAINYDRIKSQIFAGEGTVANVFWDPKTPGMDDSLTQHFTYQPDKAKALLKEARVTNASFQVAVGPNPTLKATYQIIANNLKDVGLNASIKSMDNNAFQSGLSKGELGPAFLHFTAQGGLSPQTMLDSIPQLKKNNAEKFYNDEYVSKRQAFLAATTDADKAAKLKDLTDYLLRNAPTFPIIQAQETIVHEKSIEGITHDGGGHVLLAGVGGAGS